MINFATQSRRLIPLFFVIFIDTVGYFLVIAVFLRLFFNDHYGLIAPGTALSTRNLIYGITVTLSPLAFLLLSPFAGNFSDQHGRKLTIFICLLLSFIGFFLPIMGIYRHNLALILIGRFLAGAGTSSQPVAQAAIADFTQGKQKAFYLSLIAFAMTLGMVLGSLGGGYLSDDQSVAWFNVMTPYWLAIILSLINIVLLVWFYHEPHVKKEKSTTTTATLKILFEIIFRSNVSRLLIVFFLLELAWSQYFQVIFLYLSEHYHYSTHLISLYTAYIGFWMSLGLTVVYRFIVRYFSISRILTLSMSLSVIGYLACTVLPGTTAQWLFVILVATFTGIAYASLLAQISNQASAAHQGWIMGVASTLLGLAWMITAFLSGWLINIYHHLPFIVSTVAILIATMTLWAPHKVSDSQ